MVLALLAIGYVATAQVSTTPQNASAAHEGHTNHQISHADMPKHMAEMNTMLVKHLGESDPEYDKRFIDLMIPHHEGAVLMAKHALKHSTHPEIKQMATKAIKEQQKEIEQLKQWRKTWYGTSVAEK